MYSDKFYKRDLKCVNFFVTDVFSENLDAVTKFWDCVDNKETAKQFLTGQLTKLAKAKEKLRIYTPLGQNICILFYFQAFCKFIGL